MLERRGTFSRLRPEGAAHDLVSWERNRPLAVGRDESVRADERGESQPPYFLRRNFVSTWPTSFSDFSISANN